MEFSVVIPPHDSHLQCFAEVADSIACALQDLGHHALVERAVQPGTRGIFCGLPLGSLPPDAIIYNGEQVSSDSIWGARGLARLYRGHTVWDYSSVNAARYPKHGLPVPQVVRPGYYHFDLRGEATTKSFDVAFVGSSNPRREKALAQLQDRGLTLLRVPFGVYGAERDDLLLSARLCINIHFYETAIFESVRCSHLATLGIPVLSEVSAGDEGTLYGMGGVPYRLLADFAKALIDTPGARHKQQELQATCLRALPMKDQVGAALEALDHAPVTRSIPAAAEPVGPPPITLCMIVKDEADVIERCIGSVKPIITGWAIVDTGSTDGTQDKIRRALDGVPGVLQESSWKEFDGSRTEAIELARRQADGRGWLLLIDADEQLIVERLSIPDDPAVACYDGWVTRSLGARGWGRPLLIRADKPWYYEMPRHEALMCREHAPTAPHPIEGVRVLSTWDGARAKRDPCDRFLEDARVLEAWLVRNPNSLLAARAQYYIAQSYKDGALSRKPPDRNALQRAVNAYLKRAQMSGIYPQEEYSAILWAADCMDKLGYPWEQVMQQLLRGYEYRPQRAETMFYIGRWYREHQRYLLAVPFLRVAASIPMTTDIFHDVDPSVYTWRAKDELAVALSWLGNWGEAKDLFRQALEAPDLPSHERLRIQENLAAAVRRVPD